jgi:hypothetical protein
MKHKILLVTLLIFVFPFFIHSTVFATRGCCSYHGGVSSCDTSVGRYICSDGTYSPTCLCWKSQTVQIIPTAEPTKEPTIAPTEDYSIYFVTVTPTLTPLPIVSQDVLGATDMQKSILWFGIAGICFILLIAVICIYQVTKKKEKEHTDWGQTLVDNLKQHALQGQQETKKEKPQRFKFLSSLKEKHEGYFKVVWYISFGIGMFYGFIRLLAIIFNAIRVGDFAGFALAIIFNSVLVMIWGFLGGIVIFVVLFIITFIPYLIVRGFAK